MTLATRLRERRIAAGYETQAALAKACKLYPQIIQRLESGDISSTIHLSTIATNLGTTTDYLLTGRVSEVKHTNMPSICAIPLLASEDVPLWMAGTLRLNNHRMVPAIKASSRAYALQVKDDSMVGTGPSFQRGDILVIEPERDHNETDYVIACSKNTGDVYFRQVVKVAGIMNLQPLNPAYPRELLDKNYMICGVLVMMLREFC